MRRFQCSYAWPSDCSPWYGWVFFATQYYYARGHRCTYVRIFGVELEWVYPYGN